MKNIYLTSMALTGMLIGTSISAATLTDSQIQTSAGQDFTHILNGPISDGTGATLSVTVRGDFYSQNFLSNREYFSIAIDNNTLGSQLTFDSPGAYNVIQHTKNDREFSFDFLINNALFSSIMSNQEAVVLVDFAQGVTIFSDYDFSSKVSLNYNETVSPVPVPAAIWLFGSAMMGFVGLSRRKKLQA